jgi:hypothetical protein
MSPDTDIDEGTGIEPGAGTDPDSGADVAPPGRRARVRRDVVLGLKAGVGTFWLLTRFMIPAYGIALVLERLGVIDVLAKATAPVMSLLGLPGEAAVPLMVGYILNIYAAVGAMQALSLSATQVTVLAIAILIGHNLLVEGAVLYRAGMNGLAFGVLRAVAGLAAAAVANLLMGVF